MSNKTKRIVILTEVELKKTLSRLTFEIIENVRNLEKLLLVGIPTRRRLSRFFTFSTTSEVKRVRVLLSSSLESIMILFVLSDMIYQ